jgi:hypothetical protein
MPTLTTNQGIIIPVPGDLNDVPGDLSDMLTGAGVPQQSLENRLVQRFASSVDRTARNPTPQEGELSWLNDTNQFEYYNGTAWVPFQQSPQHAYNSVGGAALNNPTYTVVGLTLTGVTITVPLSGQLRVDFSATLDSSSTNANYIAPQLNAGAVIGAGATIVAASDGLSIRQRGTDEIGTSNFALYTGLTPGSSVNAFLMYRTSGAAATFSDLRIMLEPK